MLKINEEGCVVKDVAERCIKALVQGLGQRGPIGGRQGPMDSFTRQVKA